MYKKSCTLHTEVIICTVNLKQHSTAHTHTICIPCNKSIFRNYFNSLCVIAVILALTIDSFFLLLPLHLHAPQSVSHCWMPRCTQWLSNNIGNSVKRNVAEPPLYILEMKVLNTSTDGPDICTCWDPHGITDSWFEALFSNLNMMRLVKKINMEWNAILTKVFCTPRIVFTDNFFYSLITRLASRIFFLSLISIN